MSVLEKNTSYSFSLWTVYRSSSGSLCYVLCGCQCLISQKHLFATLLRPLDHVHARRYFSSLSGQLQFNSIQWANFSSWQCCSNSKWYVRWEVRVAFSRNTVLPPTMSNSFRQMMNFFGLTLIIPTTCWCFMVSHIRGALLEGYCLRSTRHCASAWSAIAVKPKPVIFDIFCARVAVEDIALEVDDCSVILYIQARHGLDASGVAAKFTVMRYALMHIFFSNFLRRFIFFTLTGYALHVTIRIFSRNCLVLTACLPFNLGIFLNISHTILFIEAGSILKQPNSINLNRSSNDIYTYDDHFRKITQWGAVFKQSKQVESWKCTVCRLFIA